MNCNDVSHHLPWYVGQDLDAQVSREVREHLSGCLDCEALAQRGQLARERLLAGGLRADLVATSTPDLWPALRPRLVDAGILGGTHPRSLPRPAAATRRWLGLGLAAAAALALLPLARLLSPTSEPQSPDSSDSGLASGAPTRVLRAEPTSDLHPVAELPAGAVALRKDTDEIDSVSERYKRMWERVDWPPQPAPGTGDGTALTGQTIGGRRLR